jgi:hypothetical protein
MSDDSRNEPNVNELLRSVKTPDHYRRDKQISEAFQEYYRELHRVLLSPVMDAEDAGPAKVERKRFMEFIALTVFTLRKFDCDDTLINKLMSYYGALVDLENGRVHPILQQTVKDHVSAESTEWWRIRATLAAALEFLIRAGMPHENAKIKLGRTKQIKKILKRNADPAKSVESWRIKLRRGSTSNLVANVIWEEALRQYEELVARNKNAEELRGQLNQCAKIFISRAEEALKGLVNADHRVP